MALTYDGHIAWSLVTVGRANDAKLTALCHNRFLLEFYDQLNNVHDGAHNLNCARASQTVNLTNVHTGLIQMPLNFRGSIHVHIVDPAVAGSLFNISQVPFFMAQNAYPDATVRATPAMWAWQRVGLGAQIAGQDIMELFPKPDRNLTLTHTYNQWLAPPPAGMTDEVTLHWPRLITEFFVWQLFVAIGEVQEAEYHKNEYLTELAKFRDWDDEQRSGEPFILPYGSADGYYDPPIME
jgi:hypothetical protein